MTNKISSGYNPVQRIRLSDETLRRLKVTKNLVKMIDNDVHSMDDLINKALDLLDIKTLNLSDI
jgi:hypothetical protein